MNSAAELPALAPEHGLIKFEQPLTERMRTFLRIEFLYEQTLFHADEPTDFGARAAVTGLLEIVTILGRGDVRTDVIKELERHAGLLGRYRSQPGVDPGRLTGLIGNIEALRTQLADAGPQLINPLKECEFLNTIRHRSAIPGGTCMFDLPDYGYWLHLPGAERRRQLEDWIEKLKPLCDAVAEVLWLTREATEAAEHVARRRALPAQLRPQRADEPRARAATGDRGHLPRDQRGPASLHRAVLALARRRRAARCRSTRTYASCSRSAERRPRESRFTRACRASQFRVAPPDVAALHSIQCPHDGRGEPPGFSGALCSSARSGLGPCWSRCSSRG